MAKDNGNTAAIPSLSFEDLKPQVQNVVIESETGVVGSVPMRPLSYAEYQRIYNSVKTPTPPVSGGGKDGPIYNRNDSEYQKEVQDAYALRTMRMILASLQLEIPGTDEDAKIESLKSIGAAMFAGMTSFVYQSSLGNMGEVKARAESFQ